MQKDMYSDIVEFRLKKCNEINIILKDFESNRLCEYISTKQTYK